MRTTFSHFPNKSEKDSTISYGKLNLSQFYLIFYFVFEMLIFYDFKNQFQGSFLGGLESQKDNLKC